jgi:hypothetical protein
MYKKDMARWMVTVRYCIGLYMEGTYSPAYGTSWKACTWFKMERVEVNVETYVMIEVSQRDVKKTIWSA